MAMRMLKLIVIDGVSPRGILATTFTKKAAQELRSRLLSWGYAVQEYLLTNGALSKMDRLWLERVDINQVRTGTIDSVCEELLRDFRDPYVRRKKPVQRFFQVGAWDRVLDTDRPHLRPRGPASDPPR